MKFNFKVQQYQTDTVDAAVKVVNEQDFYYNRLEIIFENVENSNK